MILLQLVSLMGCNCSSSQPASPVVAGMPLIPSKIPEHQIIAKVNGVPVLKSDLIQQMKMANQNADEALRALIQEELLAQEAWRRGIFSQPSVQKEQQRALANLLIHEDFGSKFGLKDVPQEYINNAYQLNEVRYHHPEMVILAHIVVMANSTNTLDFHHQALALAKKTRKLALLARSQTEEEFKKLADMVSKEAPTMTVKAESLMTPKRGLTVPEFADAAFAMHKTGQISPVVQTRYGYHVIYYKKRIPAIEIPLEQVADEIRERIFHQVREQIFLKWMESMEKKYQVTAHLELLSQKPIRE